ncbi:hypothetical protein YN1HA_8500 [Sulfurisphaera ohwakuensis]
MTFNKVVIDHLNAPINSISFPYQSSESYTNDSPQTEHSSPREVATLGERPQEKGILSPDSKIGIP